MATLVHRFDRWAESAQGIIPCIRRYIADNNSCTNYIIDETEWSHLKSICIANEYPEQRHIPLETCVSDSAHIINTYYGATKARQRAMHRDMCAASLRLVEAASKHIMAARQGDLVAWNIDDEYLWTSTLFGRSPSAMMCLYSDWLWLFPSRELHLHSFGEIVLMLNGDIDKRRRKFEKLGRLSTLMQDGGVRTSIREPIPEEVRMFVWRRDFGKCVRCSSEERLEFDHIIPLARGGSNTARNIQLLCEQCNRSKSDSI